jgi:hypothetical protein
MEKELEKERNLVPIPVIEIDETIDRYTFKSLVVFQDKRYIVGKGFKSEKEAVANAQAFVDKMCAGMIIAGMSYINHLSIDKL